MNIFDKFHKFNIYNFYISPIPEEWYEKKTSDIDKNSISEAIKTLLNKYIDWEKGVKEKYTTCAKELMSLEYEDELEAIDYDPLYIKQIQERYCIEYK